MSVLVTGATGFVGGYVAGRLLETTGEEVVCVVRGEDPQGRLDAALAPVVGPRLRGRARAVAGDLATGSLDVDVAAVTHVVHCAANVQFDQPLAAARAVNVAGARAVAALAARAPRLQRLVHVSTAYVGGTAPGRFREDQLDVGQGFRNAYEQSKHEAEHAARAAGLPLCVVRPSIVMGESATGWTSSFNVLYPPLRAFARGLVGRVPADPTAIVDIVPVDHVADVVLAALAPDAPDTLHAVASDDAPVAAELAALVAGLMGRPVPALDPDDASLPPGGLEIYAPYFTMRARFDAARARALGLRPPPLAAYMPRLLAFAERARWGKRIPPRSAAAPLTA